MQILKIKSSCFPALAELPTRLRSEVPRMHGNRAVTNPSAPRQMRIFRARTDEAGGGAAAGLSRHQLYVGVGAHAVPGDRSLF
jgi:hypothetical protein